MNLLLLLFLLLPLLLPFIARANRVHSHVPRINSIVTTTAFFLRASTPEHRGPVVPLPVLRRPDRTLGFATPVVESRCRRRSRSSAVSLEPERQSSPLRCDALGGGAGFTSRIRRCCLPSLCCGSFLRTRSDQAGPYPVLSCSFSESWPVEVLVSLHQTDILQLSNPIIFCDFLMRLYNIGEVISVMAPGDLFTLMTQCGLEYPCFYEMLLVSCLKSLLLPAYLAAALAKKLSQLALSVLPAVALVIVAPIHNLFQWHPTINCLVHREDGESEAKDDLKIEEQIVGNRNDSSGTDLPMKSGSDLFCDASGPSKSLKPEVHLKAKSMNLLSILMVPSATKIAKKIKLMFTKSWISFLRLSLPFDVYKEVLVSLQQAVIPQLSNPYMFRDFLMRSYNIGGVVSVMALSSRFILMTQHGLGYSYFYEEVYALLQPSIFIAKHRLLVSFLKSPLLAAAFAKKMSPLALSVLPAGALVIVAPICNLLRLHSSITCLVQKESIKKTVTRTRSLLQPHRLLRLLFLLSASLLSATVPVALGEVGTASYFGPPYDRTECYGEGSSQFPESNLFAAVGDGLWDLGAACGREYEVRCISKAQSGPGHCKPGASTIRVKVVDYALSVESSAAAPRQSVTGADLVLSQAAFEAIANPSVASISVEFKEL